MYCYYTEYSHRSTLTHALWNVMSVRITNEDSGVLWTAIILHGIEKRGCTVAVVGSSINKVMARQTGHCSNSTHVASFVFPLD